MHSTLDSLSLGRDDTRLQKQQLRQERALTPQADPPRQRQRLRRAAASLGDGDGRRLHKFPLIQMSIAASELSRSRAGARLSKGAPAEMDRTHARAHAPCALFCRSQKEKVRQIPASAAEEMDRAIKPITGSVHLPSAPLLGHFRLLSPGKMRIGGRLRFSAAKISSAFGEKFRVAAGV